jgi:hypothetical protein
MSARIRQHIRSHYVGYLSLFVALSGVAYAADGPLPGQDQVGSADIIDTEVKAPDIGLGAVRSDEVLDESLGADDIAAGAIGSSEVGSNALTGLDLAGDSVGSSELSPEAFNTEIAEVSRGGEFGIANDSIQSQEVSADSLSGSDIFEASLAPSIHGVAVSGSDSSFGPEITPQADETPQTVLSDEIGAGTWVAFGDIEIFNGDTNPTGVGCGIYTGDARREWVTEDLEAIVDDSGYRVNLPLTAAFTLSSGTTLRLACRKTRFSDNGELKPISADLVAIPVNSLG